MTRYREIVLAFALAFFAGNFPANSQEVVEIDLAAVRAAFEQTEKALSNLSLAYSFPFAQGRVITHVEARRDGFYRVCQGSSSLGFIKEISEPVPANLYMWENGVGKTYVAATNSGTLHAMPYCNESGFHPGFGHSFQNFTYCTYARHPISRSLEKGNDTKARRIDYEGHSVVELSVGSQTRLLLDPDRNWLLLGWSAINKGEEIYRFRATDHQPLENGALFPMRWEFTAFRARIYSQVDQESVPPTFPEDFLERAKKAAPNHPGDRYVTVVHLASVNAPEENPISFQYPVGSFISDGVSGEKVIVGANRWDSTPLDPNPIPDLLPLLFPGVSWSDFEAERDAKVVREIHPY